MECYVKTFWETFKDLEQVINNHIHWQKYTNYKIVSVDKMHTIEVEGNNYLMTPNTVKAIVTFNSRYATKEEIAKIKTAEEEYAKFEDKQSEIVLRKNFEDDSVVFCIDGKYHNIFHVFNIWRDDKREEVLLHERLTPIPHEVMRKFPTRKELCQFMDYAESRLEEIYYNKRRKR